jgi:hypothetical protein
VSKEYGQNAAAFIYTLRQEYQILIGVLIRQDDYRTWAEGKYFFETKQYVEWMRQVQDLFPGKKVGFVIASDEEQRREEFQPLPVHFSTGAKLGNAPFIESFAELAASDYIVTAPSTFGIWAAFLGNKPIIPVYQKGQVIEQKDILYRHLFDSIVHPHMSQSIK